MTTNSRTHRTRGSGKGMCVRERMMRIAVIVIKQLGSYSSWVVTAVLVCAISPGRAQASLIGENFEFQWLAPDTSTVYNPVGHTGFAFPDTVVGPGVEFPGADDGVFDMDLSASNILLDNFNYQFPTGTFTAEGFNGIELTDVSGTATITSVTIDPATTDAGNFSASNLTFDSEHIFINLENVSWQNGSTQILLDVASSNGTPEPGSFGTLLLGALMMGGLLRSRWKTIRPGKLA